MNIILKIHLLLILGGITFSITADAGEDITVKTFHNGSIDSNLTFFENVLDGSSSIGVIDSYLWEQVNGDELVDIINQNQSVASFSSSVGYGENDKVFTFKLTVSNLTDSDEDFITITVEDEENTAPVVTFQGLDDSENNSINCGGSIEGSEDGFECILLFLDDYLLDIVDPEGDQISSSNWYDEDNNILSSQAYSVTFTSSEPRYLIYRAIDVYGDYNDAVITINSSVQNTYPMISMQESVYFVDEYIDLNSNGVWDSGDQYNSIIIEAQISDNEHLIDDLEINWSISCTGDGCVSFEEFTDSNGNGKYDDGEDFLDCGLDRICSNNVDCTFPDINQTEGNGQWDQANLLEFSSSENIDSSTGIVSAIFYPPEVRYNSDNVQYTISVTARDPFQQNDSSISPSIASSTIIVQNINQPPEIVSYDFETSTEDESFSIFITDFEICDPDNLDNEINMVILNGSDYEIINQSQNLIMPITEDLQESTIDISFIFDDGEDFNNITAFNAELVVMPVNDIPEIIGLAPNFDFYEDNSFELSIENLIIDDPDNSFWTLYVYENDSSPFSVEELIITPFQNYNGDLIIPVKIEDDENESEIFNLTLNLIPVNDPPTSIWDQQDSNQFNLFMSEDFEDSVLFNFNEVFSDIDDDYLTFNYPADQNFNLFNHVLSESGDFIIESLFNINSGINEQDVFDVNSFDISVQDSSESISEIYNFEVAVLPKNDPPILYSGSEYVDMSPIGGELKSVTIDLMSSESTNEGEDSPYVYDVEGDSWEFKITDCPDNGKLIIGEHYEDSGIDGCYDIYEDGIGGCLNVPDFGFDGCDDEYEDGEGGCLDEINTVYISSDPNGDNIDKNGDNYDYFNNPNGTELNCNWDEGEFYQDDNFSQSWDSFNTQFIYQPNPGFRCVDQIKFKVIDDGFDFVENNGVALVVENPSESNEVIAEVFVDLCNFSPEIIAYDQESISDITLTEDGVLNVDEINLDYFEFVDLDGDQINKIHAVSWNDYGKDGLPNTNDEGEGNNQWDDGEGWADCGLDGICPEDLNYPGPDFGEGDGQINEQIIDNERYSVDSECSLAEIYSQSECEYNGGEWITTVIFQEDYNGQISVALRANDGKSAYNLSVPFIVDFFIDAVNDPPSIINAYFLTSSNDTINYIFEDDYNIEFKVEFFDIDSSSDLNNNPFNLDNLDWEFISQNDKLFVSETSPNTFYIDSVQKDWNGQEILSLRACDEESRYCSDYDFTIKTLPVNDLPFNFSANYSDRQSSLEDSTIYEDNFLPDGQQNKIIEYAISYNDVDCDSSLNNFHYNPDDFSIDPIPFDPAIFIPDELLWETDYLGDILEDFSLDNYIQFENNCNDDLKFYKQIHFNTLKDNWNGNDTIPMNISSNYNNQLVMLDTVLLPVEVLPLNDSPEDFNIDAELYNYSLDQTTFYTPCEFDNDPECTEIIHGYPFSNEDNFFRLHNVLDNNGEVLIKQSVDYSNFDLGKIIFKWDRTSDIDLDLDLNNYYRPELFYRVELVETGEYDDLNQNGIYDFGEPCQDINQNDICDPPSEFRYILAEIPDSIFQENNSCLNIIGDNNICSNDNFAFTNSNQFGWTIVDIAQPFFRYKDGFFDNPNAQSGPLGFRTYVDSSLNDNGYSYIDYFGTTEYKWKVTAYNRWWDYFSNNENETISESEEMRFFIDLERPYSNFSIIQNPIFSELYELYMITNEEVFISESSLFINDTPFNILPFDEDDNILGNSEFFYYSGQFGVDGTGIYKFELYTLDLLKNAGISDYSVSFVYAQEGVFSDSQSPSKQINLIIPDYSVVNSSGILISESSLNLVNSEMKSISDEVILSSPNLELKSPMKIRFKKDGLDTENVNICHKNEYNVWVPIKTVENTDFFEAEISDIGSFGLFEFKDSINLVPNEFDIVDLYPNPFNPTLNVLVSIPYESFLNVEIFDLNGKKIKTLFNEKVNQGNVNLEWDGLSDNGANISSGVYFVMTKFNNQTITKKVTMLK